MAEVLIVIHLLIVLALTAVVLLQRSEGGGLGMGSGGAGGFMTARGTANVLTRATALLGAGFFLTSIVLSVLSSSNRQPRSLLEQAPPAAIQPGAPTAPGGGVLDLLEQQRRQTAPAGPGAPPPAAPPQ